MIIVTITTRWAERHIDKERHFDKNNKLVRFIRVWKIQSLHGKQLKTMAMRKKWDI